MSEAAITYEKTTKAMTCEGAAVLRLTVKIPQTGNNTKIDGFYRKVAEVCAEFAEKRLYPMICGEYGNSTETDKRFRFGYVYSLDCRVFDCENDDIQSVYVKATLKKRGDRTPLAVNRFSQVWRISDGKLLPLKAVAKRPVCRRYRRAGGKEYYINGKNVVAIVDTESENDTSDVILN